MKKTIITLALALIAAIPSFAQNPLNDKADAIIGEYLVPDPANGDSKVRFTKNSDGTYNCQVFWLQYPTNPKTGEPWLDERNPDKSLRSVRCDSQVIVKGLQYNAEKKQWDGAKIYDPNRGIYAKFTGKFIANGDFEIRGTVLGIGETQQWKKLK